MKPDVEQAVSVRAGNAEKNSTVKLNEDCQWEGIGIIQFPDGSIYQGMTR